MIDLIVKITRADDFGEIANAIHNSKAMDEAEKTRLIAEIQDIETKQKAVMPAGGDGWRVLEVRDGMQLMRQPASTAEVVAFRT